MKKILFKGGTVVSPKGLKHSDVLVSGDKIVAVGRHLTTDAQVVDVSDKLIFPGFIDAHTHFDYEYNGVVTADDFDTGSRCAVAGGVTTVVDYAVQKKGETLSGALNNWHIKAFANSSCDYAFHMTVTDWREDVRRELPAMFEQGVTSFKVFTINDSLEMSDREIFELMSELKKYGGILGCHCENSGIIGKLRDDALARGETSPDNYPLTSPGYAESEAVRRFLTIARAAEAPCIALNISTAEACAEVARARSRGVRAYAETCPRYLMLDDGIYSSAYDTSSMYVCSPPLRKSADIKALWNSLRHGDLDTVGSAHCSYTRAQKRAGKDDFTKIPTGMPGADTTALLMYTYGVRQRRISLQQMCAYLSANPAKLYGMYPKKGAVKAGSDADLVIFNPKGSGVITAVGSSSACGFSPYEGVKTEGKIEKVYLRGRLVCSGGEITLEHSGRYIPRGKSNL